MTDSQMYFLIFGLVVGVVAAGIVLAKWNIQQKKAKILREEAREKIKQSLRKPCQKCGAMADPILNSGNQYRCPRCNTMFASTRHNLIVEDK